MVKEKCSQSVPKWPNLLGSTLLIKLLVPGTSSSNAIVGKVFYDAFEGLESFGKSCKKASNRPNETRVGRIEHSYCDDFNFQILKSNMFGNLSWFIYTCNISGGEWLWSLQRLCLLRFRDFKLLNWKLWIQNQNLSTSNKTVGFFNFKNPSLFRNPLDEPDYNLQIAAILWSRLFNKREYVAH